MGRIAFNSAVKITAIYIGFSVLWMLFPEWVIVYFNIDPATIRVIELIKDWSLISITAVLLFKLVSNNTSLLKQSEQNLQKRNEEMAAAYEELTAAEEELRQQLEELLKNENKISRRNECLYILHEAALTLMQEVTVDDLLSITVNRMMTISGAQFGYIYMVDETRMVMAPKIVVGFPCDQINSAVTKGYGIIGTVWETGKALVVNNYNEWESRLREPVYSHLKAGVGIPLTVGGKVVGVFSMNYTFPHTVDDEELQMLDSLAELISIALGNAYLNDALQKSQLCNQALIDAMPDSIFQFDNKGTLIGYKPGKDINLLGDVDTMVGKKIVELLPPPIAQQIMERIEQALETKLTQVFEYQLTRNGAVKYQEARIVANDTSGVIAIVRDITQRKEMEHQLQYVSLHDKVTGLYNRVYFEQELNRLNESRYLPVGIVICDIDGLKLVNDTLGHQAGDAVLISTAKIIRECFPDVDVVARVGGDEFAIIFPDKDATAIEKICHDIRDKVKAFCNRSDQIPISISIGMGVRSSREQSMDEVFKEADDNMYREKLHSSQSTRSAIVHTLAKALEARDFVTDGHADRLQDLVVELALAMGVPESRLSDLRLLGRFHDIGKVGIPDHILFKPGRLTDAEFEVMKRHCEIGYRIAQSSSELTPIADWILKHQEWWNGQGYPLGLKSEEIPLACRILAIVDAYDAMTNDRPYREALTHDVAITELGRCAGTQFDPELVAIFQKIMQQREDGNLTEYNDSGVFEQVNNQ